MAEKPTYEVLEKKVDELEARVLQYRRLEDELRRSEEKVRIWKNELASALIDVFDALRRISLGDPYVRIPETSELQLISELKQLVNFTAMNLGEIVDLSHEFAIGLAEHFDVLDRVSKGDLSARVGGKSPVELLEALKNATNTTIENISKEIGLRCRAEREVQQLNRNLEAKVVERTAELETANQGLENAMKQAHMLAEEAEAANAAKGQFLANMSHEIRTPMNGIMGMLELLLDTKLSTEQQDFTHTARESAKALLSVIDDVLDFSKVESGKLELECVDFDLRRTVEDVTHVLAISAQNKSLEIACIVDHDVPSMVQGDPGRLRQVLTNLIGNAIKFTEHGEVSIRVTLEKEEERRIVVRFEISDTGIGIPDNRRDRLFESFFQVDASHTRKYGGTGLGLAISKKLAEWMGGRIGVESVEGSGATFWFSVGLEKQAHQEIKEECVCQEGKQKRILVVGHHPTGRLVLETQLKSLGYRFGEVTNSQEAINALKHAVDEEDPFHVAIIEMHLPGMNGVALGKMIKSGPKIQHTKLVMVTSLGQRGDAALMKEIGFSAYLTKPVRRWELGNCLMAIAEKTETGDGDTKPPLVTKHSIADACKRKIRILLAEDDKTNQKVALAILKNLGYQTDAVENGAEAINALEKRNYDLVLMDIQMPGMDGLAATKIIRNQDSQVLNHGIPIIAATAHAMAEHRDQCLKAGMDGYITKPINPQQLAEVIREHISHDCNDPVSSATSPLCDLSDNEIFDRSALLERLSGDEELLDEVIEVFLEDIPTQLKKLQQALDDNDAPAVGSQGHRIKGASGNIQAQAMRTLAYEIEQAGKSSELDKAIPLVEGLVKEFEKLSSVLSHS